MKSQRQVQPPSSLLSILTTTSDRTTHLRQVAVPPNPLPPMLTVEERRKRTLHVLQEALQMVDEMNLEGEAFRWPRKGTTTTFSKGNDFVKQ
jgi:hypothetical protein